MVTIVKAAKTAKKPTKLKREKSTTTYRHYIRNADVLPEVIRAKQLGQVTPELAAMIDKIAFGISQKWNFKHYSFVEDMKAAAVLNLCVNALKFNTDKYDNPFAYYTTAIWHSFLQYIDDEKKERQARDKLLIQAGANPSFGYKDPISDDYGPTESDNVEYVIQEDMPDHTADGKEKDPSSTEPEEEVHRYKHRLPGEVTIAGPGDFIVDPVTGNITIIKK